MKCIEEAVEQSRARVAENPDANPTNANIVLMHIESPTPEGVARRQAARIDAKHSESSEAPDVNFDDALPPAV